MSKMNVKTGSINKSKNNNIKPNSSQSLNKLRKTSELSSKNNESKLRSVTINLTNGISKQIVNSVPNKRNEQNKDKIPIQNLSPSFTFGNKFSKLFNLKTNSPLLESDKTSDELQEFKELEKKLKDSVQIYSQNVRKNEGASVNTLFKVRSVLLNWLKDSEQDNLEYSKFMTEKKIKYLLKNRDRLDARIKLLESDLNLIKTRKSELEKLLGDIYLAYEVEELNQEIERFSNSYEIRMGKSLKMMEKLDEMKKMLPLLKEFVQNKEQEINITKEKNEVEKICKSSCQTLGFLSNYYKNLRKKINDFNI